MNVLAYTRGYKTPGRAAISLNSELLLLHPGSSRESPNNPYEKIWEVLLHEMAVSLKPTKFVEKPRLLPTGILI